MSSGTGRESGRRNVRTGWKPSAALQPGSTGWMRSNALVPTSSSVQVPEASRSYAAGLRVGSVEPTQSNDLDDVGHKGAQAGMSAARQARRLGFKRSRNSFQRAP